MCRVQPRLPSKSSHTDAHSCSKGQRSEVTWRCEEKKESKNLRAEHRKNTFCLQTDLKAPTNPPIQVYRSRSTDQVRVFSSLTSLHEATKSFCSNIYSVLYEMYNRGEFSSFVSFSSKLYCSDCPQEKTDCFPENDFTKSVEKIFPSCCHNKTDRVIMRKACANEMRWSCQIAVK